MNNSLLNRLTPNVYWTQPDPDTDRPVLGVVAGKRALLLVDAGNSTAHAHQVMSVLSEEGLRLPAYVVLTHWHWDHIFGGPAFDCPLIAYAETGAQIEEMAGWSWSDAALDQRVQQGIEIPFCRDMMMKELPDPRDRVLRPVDIHFSGQLDIDLGGVTARCLHVGGDHASDASIVYIPEQRVAFLSDCLYPDIYARLPKYSPMTFFNLSVRLQGLGAEWYVMGHHDAPLSRDEFMRQINRMELIGECVMMNGRDRAGTIAGLAAEGIESLDEFDIEFIENFEAGL